MSLSKVIIIGAGGVATNIGRLLQGSGISVIQILGRSEDSTKALAAQLQCPYILDPRQLSQNAGIYIISVQDREIHSLIPLLSIPADAMILHTAGGVSMDVFKNYFQQYGVLYPLQSLRKETSVVPKIPFYLDANTAASRSRLENFCIQSGLDYRWATDTQRMQLHVAAVFCSNFPNYFYALAEKFCQEQALDFSSLLPVIEETADRLSREKLSPSALQTGPAVRKDISTTEKHQHLLQNDAEAAAVYRYLTEKIMDSPIFSG